MYLAGRRHQPWWATVQATRANMGLPFDLTASGSARLQKLQSPHLHSAPGRKAGHSPGPATQSQKSSHPYRLAVPA